MIEEIAVYGSIGFIILTFVYVAIKGGKLPKNHRDYW